MNYDTLGSLPIDPDFESSAEALLEEDSTNFARLVKSARLTPSRDLVGCDFSDVDFTDSDLRGFNFSNCDLRGSYGSNFVFDETTIFDGANIESSVFSYYQSLTEFSDDYELEKKYAKLRSQNWIGLCQWIANNVHIAVAEQNKRMAIRLFFEVRDLSVKTDILLRLKFLFNNLDDYRKFIVNIIIREPYDHKAVSAAMRVASSIIGSDQFIYKMILSHAKRSDRAVQSAITYGLMRSNFLRVYHDRVKDILDVNSNRELRIYYLRRMNYLFRICVEDFIQIRPGVFVDYAFKLREIDVISILNSSSDRIVRGRIQTGRSKRGLSEHEVVLQARLDTLREILASLRKFERRGIFLLEDHYRAEDLLSPGVK